jgi:hypothetical protein
MIAKVIAMCLVASAAAFTPVGRVSRSYSVKMGFEK